jgi:hypothetical protein
MKDMTNLSSVKVFTLVAKLLGNFIWGIEPSFLFVAMSWKYILWPAKDIIELIS